MRMKKLQLFFRKEEGSHGALDLFPLVFLVVLTALIFLQSMYWLQYCNRLNGLENLSQKLLLKMSSTDGLTREDQQEFLKEASALGLDISQMDFTGTTWEDPGISYGDPLYLVIRAQIPWEGITLFKENPAGKLRYCSTVEICKSALALT